MTPLLLGAIVVCCFATLLLRTPFVARKAATDPKPTQSYWRRPILRPRKSQRNDDRQSAELQAFVVVILQGLRAGESLRNALSCAARELGPTNARLDTWHAQLSTGASTRSCIESLRDVFGDQSNALVVELMRAADDGVPLALRLQQLHERREVTRSRIALTTARRAPVKMLLPLVLCCLPAFVLLSIVPLAVSTVRNFSTDSSLAR
jgi:Flp pilus assembly protein TadB